MPTRTDIQQFWPAWLWMFEAWPASQQSAINSKRWFLKMTLRGLSARESEPLVVKLPRQSGQKDARYVHLLSGEPDLSHLEATTTEPPARRADSDRAPRLEEQVQMLKQQVEELARQFAEFRKQFE